MGRVKPLSATGHGDQKLGWSESRREATMQFLQLPDDFIRSEGIDITERPAAKWWKADSEDGSDVPIAR
jgi:hypothetical protein